MGELSDIHYVTIKKYELGISINVFLDLDISTISDVLALLFNMAEEINMHFFAEKDKNGTYDPSTLKISFENTEIKNLENTVEEIKQSLIDSNLIIKKGTSGITVKVPKLGTYIFNFLAFVCDIQSIASLSIYLRGKFIIA